jgi:hypothetical protein
MKQSNNSMNEVLLVDGFAKWSVYAVVNTDYIDIEIPPPVLDFSFKQQYYTRTRIQYKIVVFVINSKTYQIAHSEELPCDLSEISEKVIEQQLLPFRHFS